MGKFVKIFLMFILKVVKTIFLLPFSAMMFNATYDIDQLHEDIDDLRWTLLNNTHLGNIITECADIE